MAPRYEIAIGLERGHKTIRNKQTPRPVANKGVSSRNFELDPACTILLAISHRKLRFVIYTTSAFFNGFCS